MNIYKIKSFKWTLLLIATLSTCGCGVYSFTGTSISPDIKTISVQNYVNETGLGPSRLSQNFTEKLKEYFLQNSNLKLVKSDGDIQINGSVTGYVLAPVGAQQTTALYQTGQANRLTITVKTNFVNTVDETQSYNKNFSFYSDYSTGTNLTAVEGEKVEEITDQIVLDIFNASVANW